MHARLTVFLLLAFAGCNSTSLENTTWMLTEVDGHAPNRDEKSPYIRLKGTDSEQNLEGFGGCNSIGGAYRLEGSQSIIFEPISTRMFCKGRMEIENALLQALAKSERYEVRGNELRLYAGETLLARFNSE